MECGPVNRVEIFSINYDFLQSVPFSQKVLWVQLRYPAPPSLRMGELVRIVSSDRDFNPPSEDLKVLDIIGTRVALTSRISSIYTRCPPTPPFASGVPRNDRWHPWDHGWHFGNATRDMSDQPYSYRQWLYGNGQSISYLVW